MTNTNRPVTEFSHKTSTELPQERSEGLNKNPTDANARPDLNTPVKDNPRVPDMNEGEDNLAATSAGTLGGAAVGAIAGLVGGPPGAVVGGIIGGVVGGIAGNDIATPDHQKQVDNYQHPQNLPEADNYRHPDHLSVEDNYWRDEYHNRPYFNETRSTYSDLEYDRDYRDAYRVGYENRAMYDRDTDFDRAEPELRTKWEQLKGESRLNWEEAKFAVKDAWHRITR